MANPVTLRCNRCGRSGVVYLPYNPPEYSVDVDQCEQCRSPFPPEVVERAKCLAKLRSPELSVVYIHETVDEALSVIANYMRSEEARERGIAGIRAGAGITYRRAELAFDAVIAALLGEKEQG